MGGSLRKRKACTKKCPADCASNPANHVPHEHLIVAASTLVIVLAGIVSSISPSTAAPRPPRPQIMTETVCRDTDFGKIEEISGSAMIVEINKTKNTVKRLSIKSDACVDATTVRELSCRNNKTLVSQLIKCKPGTVCQKDACVPTSTVSTAPTTSSSSAASQPTTKGPMAYCVLAGMTSGDFTKIQSPDSGRGYAQMAKPSVTTFAQLIASCSKADFAKLEAAYCAIPNQPMYSLNAAMYDATGNFTVFGGCRDLQGCDFRSCNDFTTGKKTEAAANALTSPSASRPTVDLGCSDSDGGDNSDVAGITAGIDKKTGLDTCLDDSTLTEYSCGADSKIISRAVSCESGICSNGACLTLTSE